MEGGGEEVEVEEDDGGWGCRCVGVSGTEWCEFRAVVVEEEGCLILECVLVCACVVAAVGGAACAFCICEAVSSSSIGSVCVVMLRLRSIVSLYLFLVVVVIVGVLQMELSGRAFLVSRVWVV